MIRLFFCGSCRGRKTKWIVTLKLHHRFRQQKSWLIILNFDVQFPTLSEPEAPQSASRLPHNVRRIVGCVPQLVRACARNHVQPAQPLRKQLAVCRLQQPALGGIATPAGPFVLIGGLGPLELRASHALDSLPELLPRSRRVRSLRVRLKPALELLLPLIFCP